jgi:hypothetical protein
MHAAISHYWHDGRMIPLGELSVAELPWSGRTDADPKVPRGIQPKVWKFRSNGLHQRTDFMSVESNLQVKDHSRGTIEWVLIHILT